MNPLLLVICTTFFLLPSAFAEKKNKKWLEKYPYGLLTEDYGILNEDDLGINAWSGSPKPYESEGHQYGYNYWQCFPIKNVEHKYRTWFDPNATEYKTRTICTLETRVTQNKELHLYVERRTHEASYCRDLVRNWKKITKNEKYACFSGSDGTWGTRNKNGKEQSYKLWVFDRFKTKKGCYAVFPGSCDLNAWKEAGYPNGKR